MPDATLIIIPPSQVARELEISSDNITSIGRALDNTICIEGDTNISRYHAEIEVKGNDFWVYDLDSANGTTVNDEPINKDGRALMGGDMISVGGETIIEFHLGRKQILREEKEKEGTSSSFSGGGGGGSLPLPTSTTSAPVASGGGGGGVSPLLIVAGVMGGLAVAAVLGVGVWWAFFKSPCPGKVVIVSPESGTTITEPVPIRVKFNKGDEKCIDRVIYQIDGEDKIEMESAPYEAMLDPVSLGIDDGNTHILSIVVVPLKGNQRILQEQQVNIASPPSGITSLPDKDGTNQTPVETGPKQPLPAGVNLEVMSKNLATRLGQRNDYIFNPVFQNMVNTYIAEYRRVNAAANKARPYKFAINKAFVNKGLDPLIGYALAMSRSKFDGKASGSQGAGLWQMPPNIAKKYFLEGETEDVLNDPERSAEIAAAYTKELIGRFELGLNDFIYAIACFGMTMEEAYAVRIELSKATSANQLLRRDFTQMVNAGVIKPEMKDRVARFFAAGIVGENPQAFGIQDQPFSSL